MRLHVRVTLSIVVISASLTGCAGPTTPFGAINNLRFYSDYVGWSETVQNTTAQIDFQPSRQVLHARAPFSVIIEDAHGVPENFDFHLTYNDIDVTGRFMTTAKKEYLDSDKTKMRLTLPNLRLLPDRDNRVLVSYQRDSQSSPRRVLYRPPHCDVFKREELKKVAGFDVDDTTRMFIEELSTEKNLNPNFVAGLIAQESSFNPKAMSRDRALGLTQITPVGEREVLRRVANKDWPRFPGLDKMPQWQVKMGILQGRIHEDNEWRLNPRHSITGGVEYLKYLGEYWARPNKQRLILARAPAFANRPGDLLLASYNSGAARVSRAIANGGNKWLNNPQLREARKYVGKVTSYCDHIDQEDN